MNCFLKTSLVLALTVPFVFACREETSTGAAGGTDKAMDAAKGSLATMKDEFSKTANSTMAAIDKQIADLKTKAAALSAEKKPEMDKMIQDLGAKMDEVKKAHSDAMAAGEAAFTDLKLKAQRTTTELKKQVEAATAKLK